jgi:hypothetical protein
VIGFKGRVQENAVSEHQRVAGFHAHVSNGIVPIQVMVCHPRAAGETFYEAYSEDWRVYCAA